jgi:hypothetical protein
VKGRRAGAQTFTLTADKQFCFLHRLIEYLDHCMSGGYPITSVLFRPRTADRQGFKEEPYTSSSMCHNLKKYLVQAGLYAGETMHSLRRGGMQGDLQKGASFEEVQQKAQLKTANIVARYLDPARHVPKLIKHTLKRSANGK